MKHELALIDIGVFWSYWFAAKEDRTAAIDRFVGTARTISLRHNRTIVCADSPKLFRRAIPGGESYKTREPKPPEGVADLARTELCIKELGLPVAGAEGYEADDIIASIAFAAMREGWFTRVYSDDKDLEALITDGWIVVHKRDRAKGGSKDWTVDDVVRERGCPPPRIAEYLALMGDTADSIPGVPGIGKEAAAAVIRAYPNVAAIYADVDPDGTPGRVLPERTRKALAAHREALELSLKLARLDYTAPFDPALLALPQVEAPPTETTGEGDSAPDTDRALTYPEPTNDGRAETVVVLEQKPAAAPQPQRTTLDQIVDETTQRARVEGWIGRSFEDALEPRNPRDAWWLSGVLDGAMSPGKRGDSPSRTYAKIGNRQAIYAVIMKGRELRLPAMLSLAHIKPVEGKIEVDAMLMIALAIRSGRVHYVRCTETTEERATYGTLLVGDDTMKWCTWTLDTARKAGLYPPKDDRSPWARYTRVMLRWRAASELLRTYVPDAICGVYVRGELEEIDEDSLRTGLEAEKVL